MADVESPLLEANNASVVSSTCSSKIPSIRSILSVEETPTGDINTTNEKIIHFLIQVMGWSPLVLTLVGDSLFAYTSAFVAAWANILCFTLLWYQMGKTKSWPKTLDIIFIFVNGTLTMLTWSFPNSMATINSFSDTMVSGGLVLGIIVAWMLGYPLIKNHMVADSVDDEGIDHPILKHFIRRLTAMWIGVFSIMALIALVPAVINLQEGVVVSDTVTIVCVVLEYIALALGLLISHWLYPAYFDKHQDEIAAKYKDEIDMWNKEHPDHELLIGDDTSNTASGE